MSDVDVLVIGAGQAGLGTAYWLQQLAPDLTTLVVDEGGRLGQSWEDRWDSLRLFTPRRYSALPGLTFPPGPSPYPTRLEMADYLARYAAQHQLPVQLNTRVDLVRPGFTVSTPTEVHTARDVVLATGPFQDPFVPAASGQLSEQVHQVHSLHYHRPQDLPAGDVAVVGGGNSAAQIALELSAQRRVTLVAPQPPWYVPARVLGVTSYWWLSVLGILDADAEGRLARRLRRRGDAIFGTELRQPLRQGQIGLRPHRVVGAAERSLHLADGSELPVTNVVWCTGFHARYDWLDVPGAFDADGNPAHEQGASPVPGLHWMGLPWQSTLDSSIVHGVNADARRTAERVLARQAIGTHQPSSAVARRPRPAA